MRQIISPSILNADFMHLSDAVEMVNRSEADWLHLDIMDGVFVPNITFGFPVIEQIKRSSQKPLDVHLMIVNPDQHLSRFRDSGADILTVHYESCPHLHRTVHRIKELGMKAGVALNPHSPVSLLEEVLPDVDMVLIMTVNPGYGGQKFIAGSYDKIEKLAHMNRERELNVLIEVDGGVDESTTPLLLEAGVNVLVAGTYVFRANDPIKAIKTLKEISR